MGPRSPARTGGAAASSAADLRIGGGSPLRLAPARVVCRRSRRVVRDRLLARTAPRRLREPPLGRSHPALVAGLHRRDTPRGPETRRPARTKRPARTCEAGSRLNTHHDTSERTRRPARRPGTTVARRAHLGPDGNGGGDAGALQAGRRPLRAWNRRACARERFPARTVTGRRRPLSYTRTLPRVTWVIVPSQRSIVRQLAFDDCVKLAPPDTRKNPFAVAVSARTAPLARGFLRQRFPAAGGLINTSRVTIRRPRNAARRARA